MKRVAVFVATTGGLARVERITRERAPQSMVCLNRTSTVLPISADYDSFVRPGSGVIEKTFGPFEPGAFRLDVSAPIETGESWQLGFFVAHAVCAAGGVLAPPESADEIVWLTGSVDCDLAVGAVGHIAEKLHTSRAAFEAWRAAGHRVTLFLRDPGPVALPPGVDTQFVHTASDVLAKLNLPPAPGRQMLPAPARRTPLRVVAGGFALSAVTAVTLLQWPAPPVERLEAVAVQPSPAAQEASAPVAVASVTPAIVPPATRVEIVERRAPEGRTCAEVQFGTVPAIEVSPEKSAADESGTTVSALKGLCALGVTIDNGETARFVAVDVEAVTGKLLYGTVRPDSFGGQQAFGGRQQWAIDVPRRLPGPFEIRVTAVSGDHAVSEDTGAGAATTLHHRVLP